MMLRRLLAALVILVAGAGVAGAQVARKCASYLCAQPAPVLDLNFLGMGGVLPSLVTYTGASLATQYNSSGQLAYKPHNFVQQSGTFTNAVWANITGTPTVLQGQSDPDGGTSAVKLTATGVTDQWGENAGVVLVVGMQYVWSAWVRSDSAVSVPVAVYDGVTVNSHTFAVTTTWTRYQYAFTATGTSARFQLFASPANGTVAYFAKAQLEASLQGAALGYSATTAAAYYGPRFDYDPASATSNFLIQSNTFSSSAWTRNFATYTQDAVDPYGNASTAWSTVPNAGTNNVSMNNTTLLTVSNGSTYTYSGLFKNGTLGKPWVELTINAGTTFRGWFNLSTGLVGTSSGSPTAYSITPSSGGYYRLQMTFVSGAALLTAYVSPRDGDGNGSGITGDGATAAHTVYGLQLQPGSAAGPYVATGAIPASCCAASRGLLIEEARTNLMLQSTFASGWTAGSSSLTQAATAGPDAATGSAVKIVEAAATAQHLITELTSAFTAGATITASAYLKQGERTTAWLQASEATFVNGFRLNVNLATCAIVSSTAIGTGTLVASSATAQTLPNSWCRVSVAGTVDPATTTTATIGIFLNAGASYLGDGTSGLYAYGADVQAGSFVTTYIPTTTATVARVIDAATVATSAFAFNPNAGTLIGEGILGPSLVAGGSSGHVIAQLDDGTSSNVISLLTNDNGLSTFLSMAVSGHGTGGPASTGISANVPFKLGGSFIVGAQSLSLNGGTIGTATYGFLPTMTTLRIGAPASGNQVSNGWVRRVRYWNQRLPDARLQQKTSSLFPANDSVLLREVA